MMSVASATRYLFEREAINESVIGRTCIAVGCGDRPHLLAGRPANAGERELETVAGQMHWIDNAPVGGFGLQLHVEGQRIVGPGNGEAVEPCVVMRRRSQWW